MSLNYESINGLIDWLGQNPHDPITCDKQLRATPPTQELLGHFRSIL
jgi:hypothetical protein